METAEHLRIIKAKIRPELSQQVRLVAVQENTTMEELVKEGLELMLQRRSRLAARRARLVDPTPVPLKQRTTRQTKSKTMAT